MTRIAACKILIWEWLLGLVAIVAVMLVQTLSGKYGHSSYDAWALLALVFVTPLAMLVTSVINKTSEDWRTAHASGVRFWLAFLVGGVFIAAVLSIMLGGPLITMTYFQVFEHSSVALALWQCLVVAAIGAVVFEGR